VIDEANDKAPKPPARGAGPRFLLEKGRPDELVPDGTRVPGPFNTTFISGARADMKNAARKYCLDPYNADDAKERVRRVWLDGKYQRPWEPYTPREGKEPDFG
jgi:hypothetical protein